MKILETGFLEDHCNAYRNYSKWQNWRDGNIGGNSEISNIDLIKRIIMDLDQSFEHFIEFVSDRPGYDFRYAIDNSKILNEIGWKPKNSFKKGLKTIRWYLNNLDWLSNTGRKR